MMMDHAEVTNEKKTKMCYQENVYLDSKHETKKHRLKDCDEVLRNNPTLYHPDTTWSQSEVQAAAEFMVW